MSEVGDITKEINEKAKKGEHIALYLDDFLPKFSKVVPSIVRGELTLITGSTGSGKTQFTKAVGVNYPIEYAEENDVDLKIIYLCLEETELEFRQKMTVRFLHQEWVNHFRTACDISYSHMNGSRKREAPDGSGGYFSEKELELIDQCSERVDDLLDKIHLITDVGSPTVLYKKCEQLAQKWGNYDYKQEVIEFEDPITGDKSKLKQRVIDYTPGPNEHVILIADHLALMLPETDPISRRMLNERQTIAKWNSYYCREIFCKRFQWSVINVIQQNFDTDKLDISAHGDKLIEKAKPSMGNIGNAREAARDAHNVWGIFNPNKFEIQTYKGYNIDNMGDTFRSWLILKHRNGLANMEGGMFYDGISQYFMDLPNSDHPEMEDKYYPLAERVNERF